MINIETFQRVVYEKNPLVEVLCQVRFGELIAFNNGQVHEFHKRVSDLYPLADVFEGLEFPFVAPVAQVTAAVAQPKKATQFTFSDVDLSWQAGCSSTMLSLTCRKYESWSNFSPKLDELLKQFFSVFEPKMVTRNGLRFKNVVDQNLLGTDFEPLSELIAAPVNGLLGSNWFDEKSFQQSQSQYQASLGAVNVILNFGLIQDHENNKGYLIDADCFTADKMAATTQYITDQVNKLHNCTGPIFRQCITDKLHNLLRPKSGS